MNQAFFAYWNDIALLALGVFLKNAILVCIPYSNVRRSAFGENFAALRPVLFIWQRMFTVSVKIPG